MRDAMNVDEARARDDVLDLRAAETGRQIAEQRDFALSSGGKVGMAAL